MSDRKSKNVLKQKGEAKKRKMYNDTYTEQLRNFKLYSDSVKFTMIKEIMEKSVEGSEVDLFFMFQNGFELMFNEGTRKYQLAYISGECFETVMSEYRERAKELEKENYIQPMIDFLEKLKNEKIIVFVEKDVDKTEVVE